ncbi:unnamed protein product [Dimorphilus gyrociliatus]|uniref:Uncharacterized protein n=1 Tax=Dimorphilus gyrociliatus TaxID=2664684 RepID=A0A7I8VKQ6_9ANNE|nr:unnamed protein product [Dimorphilus gyrociliatus]
MVELSQSCFKMDKDSNFSKRSKKEHKIRSVGTYSFLRQYIAALRPWSLSASLIPVSLGSVLSYKIESNFSLLIYLCSCLTALSVHSAGNLVNTYFDFKRGVDNKKSDDRTLVDEILTPNNIATLGSLFYIFGCFGFGILCIISPAEVEHLALIYFGGLSSSFLYTGGLGLKYIALGDIIIFLTFGPITVLFAYLTQCGQLSTTTLIYAIPLALNTEAILHANNTRDRETDRAAGIVTLAIYLGETGSYILFCFLLFIPHVVLMLCVIHRSVFFILPVLTCYEVFRVEKEFRAKDLRFLPKKLAMYNVKFGIAYIIACFLSI